MPRLIICKTDSVEEYKGIANKCFTLSTSECHQACLEPSERGARRAPKPPPPQPPPKLLHVSTRHSIGSAIARRLAGLKFDDACMQSNQSIVITEESPAPRLLASLTRPFAAMGDVDAQCSPLKLNRVNLYYYGTEGHRRRHVPVELDSRSTVGELRRRVSALSSGAHSPSLSACA